MNGEMSTTKESVIWEERNSIEPKKKLENNGESDVCGIITDINEESEKKTLKDITEIRVPGIYKIINKVNGKYYVGSSKNIKYRWNKHIKMLNDNDHSNQHLQNAWNKYGKESFIFKMIEKTTKENTLIIEQNYLDIAKLEPNQTYNMCFDVFAVMKGRKHSPKSLQKLKERWMKFIHPMKGKHHSTESKKLMSLSCRDMFGKNNPMYGKQSAMKGKHHSTESKIKMSKNNCRFWLNKTMSEETKQKMRNSNSKPRLGKHHTDEAKQKLSISRRDKTIYHFKNKNTNESFYGISYDFSKKFNLIPLSVRSLILKRMKTLYGWYVNEKAESVPTSQN